MALEEIIAYLRGECEHLERMLGAIQAVTRGGGSSVAAEASLQPSREHHTHIKIRREMIVHGDHQINHRVSVLLTTQCNDPARGFNSPMDFASRTTLDGSDID